MGTQYPCGKLSSRAKDLVDLVLIAHTQPADLEELRAAIAAKRALGKIGPSEHFDIPDSRRIGPHLPSDRERRPSGRVFHRANRSRLRGILRRHSVRQAPETGCLEPAGDYLNPGQEQLDDSPGRHLRRK